MPYSDPDSPSSSVQSSPNAPRRFLPLHILKTLSPSKQIIPTISDSDSESEDESVSLPTSYYTSPSRPEKRRHLTVPSPRMAMLSIDGPARRLRSSHSWVWSGNEEDNPGVGCAIGSVRINVYTSEYVEYQRN